MSSPAIAPAAVWDARAREWCADMTLCDQRIAWACEHISRPNDTYRVEFYLVDAPFAVLHRYAVNAEGRKYALAHYSFISDGEPAAEEPATVMLDELPPAHLLRP